MSQPEGFTSLAQSLHVCKLQRSLYGLKQAPRVWFTKLKETLNRFGFTYTKSNMSLFTRFSHSSVMYILAYVDNILVTGTSQMKLSNLIAQLNAVFALKNVEKMSYFLGIEAVKPNDNDMLLCQTKYIKDLLTKAGTRDAKAIPTPMVSSLKLSAYGFCVFLGPNLVLWSSRKQNAVSKSSTEAEYQGLVAGLTEILWDPKFDE
ncbi:uncharacterized mitochondrial protein AtMg00810-like [Arachis duranensis]|uniref:Uncharacterized mitochondrial protein AtMg00810-like n=1 Tax=Arachis duranensis TaxID=130453 RepID=A0A6P5MBD1_ARADU|nr:uncharacterized mitochondrial protein AtMg00810-like [Arachis duranensis]